MRPHALLTCCLIVAACAGKGTGAGSPAGPGPVPSAEQPSPGPAPQAPQQAVHDVDALGVPRFVTSTYIDLGRVTQISKFRSGEGHSYTDNFETCRSMKHYFQTPRDASASSVRVYAPVTGEVIRMDAEWAGTQLHIRPADYPAFWVILFHVTPGHISVGSRVHAGEQIGTHVGSQTMSDVAIAVNTPAGFKLVSWFDAISDEVFDGHRARGVASREEMIISRAARDASPLSCTGETFAGKGTLPNWVVLR